MRKYIVALLLLLMVSMSVRSQSFIHFTTNQYPSVTNKHVGDTIVISDSIYNTGLNPFNSDLWFNAKLDTTSQIYMLDSPGHTFLDSNQTRKPIDIHIPLYRVGPSIIVIWPVYSGGGHASLPIDTIRFSVDVLHPLGLDEAPLAKVYLYQMDGYMFVNFGDAEKFIQQVRLYDIQGREIYSDGADRSRRIPTGQWRSGVYFCEITSISGQRKVIKLKIDN